MSSDNVSAWIDISISPGQITVEAKQDDSSGDVVVVYKEQCAIENTGIGYSRLSTTPEEAFVAIELLTASLRHLVSYRKNARHRSA